MTREGVNPPFFGRVHVEAILYIADVTPLENEEYYALAYAAVTESRRLRTDRYLRAEDRFLSLGGELLLKKSLADAGLSLADLQLSYGEKGKPKLAAPEQLHFNISHSGSKAICAVGKRELGCDVEKIGKYHRKTAERFTPEEFRFIEACPEGPERDRAFCRIWTMKESFMKAVGLGFSLPLAEFSVIPESGAVPVRQHLNGGSYFVREYPVFPEYCISLCTQSDSEEVSLQTVTMEDLLK